MKIQENKIKKEKLDLMKANDLQIKFFRILFTPLSVEGNLPLFSPSCEGKPIGRGESKEHTPSWLRMPPLL
jgi:hypothetical protein